MAAHVASPPELATLWSYEANGMDGWDSLDWQIGGCREQLGSVRRSLACSVQGRMLETGLLMACVCEGSRPMVAACKAPLKSWPKLNKRRRPPKPQAEPTIVSLSGVRHEGNGPRVPLGAADARPLSCGGGVDGGDEAATVVVVVGVTRCGAPPAATTTTIVSYLGMEEGKRGGDREERDEVEEVEITYFETLPTISYDKEERGIK
uniref:Uncharacterized protein n=1 Tax=Oryza punctata TaxID=4537 RepID=A0A0E0JWC1_ORYPU